MKKFFSSKWTLSVLIGLSVSFLLYYFTLPALNVRSYGFWLYMLAVILAFSIPWLKDSFKVLLPAIKRKFLKREDDSIIVYEEKLKLTRSSLISLIALAVPVAVIIVGAIISTQLFRARSYAAVISIENAVFAEEMPETNEITHIALMDTKSAQALGDKTLGALSDTISQYDVNDFYTQINYQGTPKKVSNLEYADFFKWLSNSSKGVPGMVMVDPVNSSAEYIKFSKPMQYVDSAYFGKDLERKLRFEYPTKIFDSISFEIDDNGNPYYIVSCVKPRVGLFGAKDIHEVIIFNPCDGSSKLYSLNEVPSWVDIVFTGDLACEKFNWNGLLSGGYLNSIIGNAGCRKTTDDFGYVAIEDDVWYFTGVTSVTADKSNVGFMLSNARTGQYKFYPVIGAEEHSAMSAAEGRVQEKGYEASFPSLVNISGQATYIMMLKDSSGIVQLHALVNVENHSWIATGSTQAAAISEYKKILQQNNISIGEAIEPVEITVENVRITSFEDDTTVYITADNGDVYKGYLEVDERLILVRVGDKLTISYSTGDTPRIYIISSWDFAE